jgi:hypothetical protein
LRIRRPRIFARLGRVIGLSVLFIALYTFSLLAVEAILDSVWASSTTHGVSLTDLARKSQSDLVYGNIISIMINDLIANNPLDRMTLFMWCMFLGYLDVVYETFILLILCPFSILRAADPNRLVPQPTMLEKFSTRAISFLNKTRATSNSEEFEHIDSPVASSIGSVIAVGKTIHEPTTAEDDPIILPSDSVTCIMMSVMNPCATEQSKESFVGVLKSIRSIAEFDVDIFVIDCGATREPIDNTEYVIKTEVSQKIHYVYYPEPDRTAALYWTSKFWIPNLFNAGMCGDYIYTVITDECMMFPDRDEMMLAVSRPLLPSSEYLMNNPDVKAYYIPFRDEVRNVVSAGWIKRLGERVHIASMQKFCNTALDTGSFSTVQLWERNTFEMTCFKRNCNVDRNLNQLPQLLSWRQNCLELQLDRGASKIHYWVGPNTTTDDLPELINSSPDIFIGQKPIGSVCKYVYELINPSSLFHGPSFVHKMIILPEVINAVFDCIRLFIIPGFVFRDPLGFAVTTAVVSIVMIIPYIAAILLNHRYEVDKSKKIAILVFVYPFVFILKVLPIRAARMIKDILSHLILSDGTDMTIEEREEELRDLPPVPPHVAPHWSTLWTGK